MNKIRICLLFFVTIPITLYSYSSEFLEEKNQTTKIRTYYPRHLNELRRAVPPRTIRYVDASNYNIYGKLIVQGVLFTYRDPNAKKVFWVSNTDGYKPHPMRRNHKGVWLFIYEPPFLSGEQPQRNIEYKFLVDGMFETDPTNSLKKDDGVGGFLSVYQLQEQDFIPATGVQVSRNKKVESRDVLIRIYAPDAKTAAVAGTFNSWNWDYDYMKKTKEGYFILHKRLLPGTYYYKYRIDGEWKIQTFLSGMGKHGKAVPIPQYTLKHHPVFGTVIELVVR
ncbi:MAG: hypothetical protein D6767_07180 [Candidatus Hydrogenedentota bacterium]|nr:MAG: hypothetical protein D6767_07180 [Candidatus Hydrogenedentota bacterium]